MTRILCPVCNATDIEEIEGADGKYGCLDCGDTFYEIDAEIVEDDEEPISTDDLDHPEGMTAMWDV